MADLWNDCFEPQLQVTPDAFTNTFCKICRNLECERSASSKGSWSNRIATQVDRLLINPKYADPRDPQFESVRATDFPSKFQEALILEVAAANQDWVPVQAADTQKYVDRMTTRPTPATAKPDTTKIKQKFEVRGSGGTKYFVTEEERVEGKVEWFCTCKSYEFSAQKTCKHIQSFSKQAPVEPEEVLVAPVVQGPPIALAGKTPFTPPKGNLPVPSGGIMIGGDLPPLPVLRPAVDEWAAPPPKPKETLVPIGGKVTMGKK